MKLLLALLFLIPGCAFAFELTFSDVQVIGTVGASYANKNAPDYSPFAGGWLNNGGYYDLNEALTNAGFTIITKAQGGATSYDQYAVDEYGNQVISWRGIQTQVDILLQNAKFPLWPDRTKVVVFTLLNDCIHSVPCTESDMDIVMQRIYDAALTVHESGKGVIINAYPKWASLHLKEAMEFYFGPGWYTISEDDYAKLVSKQEAKFSNVPWIKFVKPWEKAGIFPDGLHPGKRDMDRAAHIVGKAIEDLL